MRRTTLPAPPRRTAPVPARQVEAHPRIANGHEGDVLALCGTHHADGDHLFLARISDDMFPHHPPTPTPRHATPHATPHPPSAKKEVQWCQLHDTINSTVPYCTELQALYCCFNSNMNSNGNSNTQLTRMKGIPARWEMKHGIIIAAQIYSCAGVAMWI